MAIFDYQNNKLSLAYDINGNKLTVAFDILGNIVWQEESGEEPGRVFIPYTFAAISDVHYGFSGKDEYERFTSWCLYTASNMPDLILATGDFSDGNNYKTTSANHPRAALQAAGIPYTFGADDNVFHWAWGNHENNSTDTLDTLCAAFDETMGAGASQTNWFDFQGDRFIIMHFRNMSNKRAQFTVNDLETLKDALNTAEDKRVFLIQHCPDFSRTMCGKSGKADTTHWGYNAPGIAWEGETLDVREIFRRIVDAHVAAHPGKLIWLHGHTHKPVEYNGDNYDTTYFLGNGYTVHIPSLGRPYLLSGTEGATSNGETTSFGEWALFHVEKDSVLIEYYRTDDTTLESARHLSGYDITIPYAAS